MVPTGLLPVAHAADPWFDDAWLFRRAVTVTNPNATPLTDFQVEVDLDASNFSFAEAIPNGADLRFTTTSGTLQPHWVEKFEPVTTTGKVWVKVSSIPASGSTTLYLYYGNPQANQGSDGNATFSFFDDFDDANISDWTKNFVNEGVNSFVHFYSGKIGLLVQSIDYGNIRRQYTGSLVGKTVEGNLEYGFPNNGVPNSTSAAMGESFHPKMAVYVDDANQFTVGGVQWSAGTLPIDNLRRQIDNLFTLPAVNTPIFSYGIGDVVVNRISFPDATTVESALREDSSNTWEGTATDVYPVADLDNAFIVLGKQPESSVALGGGLAYNTWDWVRIREYAPLEPTTAVAGVEAQRLQARLQLDNSMPGALRTQYTFTVTPNMPIPNGGALEITFPTSFANQLNALTPSSVVVAPHAQITGTTPTINTGTRTIRLAFTSSAPIVDTITITVGDGAGAQGDIIHPTIGGPHTISFTSKDGASVVLATGQLSMSTAGWWDTNWQYRESLHVNNSKVISTLPAYQVQVRLDNTNFDFAHAQSQGQDLRFVTPDGTELPYWIETYDNIGETAMVWVGMTNLPANTEQMIFLYHGNNLAASLSNGSAIFDFFDDFEDNDVSDWTTYSATPGAITVVGGTVKINELQNTRAFLMQNYTGSIDGKALEGVIRYIDPAIGEEYSPSLGYVLPGTPTTQLMITPRRYNFGTTPTDRLATWLNSTRYDKLGTNYNIGEDIVYSLNTKGNYFIAQSRRYANTAWDMFDTNFYNQSQLAGKSIHFGKRAWGSPNLDLNTGPLAEHDWKNIRLRDFIYFEPTTLLGSEELNNLPAAPTGLFINTATAGASSNAADPLQFTTKNLAISAIYNAATTLEQATRYDYDIATDAGFTSIIDSVTNQALAGPLTNGQRSADIAFNAAALNFNTNYYVRLRFYDATGLISPSSTAVQFAIPDVGNPTLSALVPAASATGVDAASNISFTLSDGASGVDTATLDVTVGGTAAITGGLCQAGFACSITPSGNDFAVIINPDTNFGPLATINLSIAVDDLAGNSLAAASSFTTAAPAATTTTPATPFTGGGGGAAAPAPSGPSAPTPAPSGGNTGSSGSAGSTSAFVPDALMTDDMTAFFPLLGDQYTSKPALPPLETTPAGRELLARGGNLHGSAPLQASATACDVMSDNYNYTLPENISPELLEEISLLHKFGVNFSGERPGVLQLQKPVTRSEILKYLLQLTCADYDKDISEVPRFPDVATTHPHDLYIHLGRKYGLVNGYLHSGRFEPDKVISHAEALKIAIENMLRGSVNIDGEAMMFRNLDYSLWYGRYIRFASDRGMLHTSDDFHPDAPIVLEEAIHLLVKAITLRPYK